MFRTWFKRGVMLAAVTSMSTSHIFSSDFDELFHSLKLLAHLPGYQESKTLESASPSLLYLYDSSSLEQSDPRLDPLFKRASSFGYSVQKRFVNSSEDRELLKEKLHMTDEEIELRLKHNSNFVYIHGERVHKIPIGTQLKDIDSWVAKCQQPVIRLEVKAQFYAFCRKIVSDDEDFVLVYRGLGPEARKVAEMYSRLKYKLPIIELPEQVCEELGIPAGVTVVQPFSKFNGEFEVEKQGKLKFLTLTDQDFNIEQLDNWVKSSTSLALSYIDSYDKIYPMFSKVYNGPLKVLYVMTSQMNPYSKKYDELLGTLIKIQKKYGSEVHIAILPNDDIAKKLGVLRNKRLRRFRTPELRFLDFGKLVGITKVEGEYPIIDCSSDKTKCSELVDTHYTRKAFFDKPITEEGLGEFVEKCMSGDYQQYYETDTTPSAAVRKLCGKDFVKEVIEADRDVIVEFYGKYCPGCRNFKKYYSEIAQELQELSDTVTVAKICIDYNMIPEISDKKPYTPIFWIYKKGQKSEPVQYKGKIEKSKLISFIRDNLTESSKIAE